MRGFLTQKLMLAIIIFVVKQRKHKKANETNYTQTE